MTAYLPNISEKIKEYENTLETVYKTFINLDPERDKLTEEINFYNNWSKEEKEKLNENLDEIQEINKEIDAINKKINELDVRYQLNIVNPENDYDDEKYISERNKLVKDNNELIRKYTKLQDEYNEKVNKFNSEIKKKHEELEKKKQEMINKEEVANEWFQSESHALFYQEVLELYCYLITRRKSVNITDMEFIEKDIERVKKIKLELNEFTKNYENHGSDNPLIVNTEIQSNLCYFLVSTSSSLVSLSKEMVQILEIENCVGEEIELVLPNRMKMNAPTLYIPDIKYKNNKTELVKAVVMQSTIGGIDGTLGLSFLNRFNYTINEEDNKEPTLKLLGRNTSSSDLQYDVFISYNKSDKEYAEKIFNCINERNIKVFYAPVSLYKCNRNDWQVVTEGALTSSKHMIVVGSSKKNIEAPWVEMEWRMFIQLKNTDKNKGNLIPLLCGKMQPNDLPISLISNNNAVFFDDSHLESNLFKYLESD